MLASTVALADVTGSITPVKRDVLLGASDVWSDKLGDPAVTVVTVDTSGSVLACMRDLLETNALPITPTTLPHLPALVLVLQRYECDTALLKLKRTFKQTVNDNKTAGHIFIFIAAALLGSTDICTLAIRNGGRQSWSKVLRAIGDNEEAELDIGRDVREASSFDMTAAGEKVLVQIPPATLTALWRAQLGKDVSAESGDWDSIADGYKAVLHNGLLFEDLRRFLHSILDPSSHSTSTPYLLPRAMSPPGFDWEFTENVEEWFDLGRMAEALAVIEPQAQIVSSDDEIFDVDRTHLKVAAPGLSKLLEQCFSIYHTNKLYLTDRILETSLVIRIVLDLISPHPIIVPSPRPDRATRRAFPDVIRCLQEHGAIQGVERARAILRSWAQIKDLPGKLNTFVAAAHLGDIDICTLAIINGNHRRYSAAAANNCDGDHRLDLDCFLGDTDPFDLGGLNEEVFSRIPTRYTLAILRAGKRGWESGRWDLDAFANRFREIMTCSARRS